MENKSLTQFSCQERYQKPRYTDDTTLMAESEEELKSLLMKVKEESEKAGVTFNIQKLRQCICISILYWCFSFWRWNMYNIIYEMNRQSKFDAWYWMLRTGSLRWPRGMVQGERREGGSGWGTCVYLWRIHVDVWQNQYNIVK